MIKTTNKNLHHIGWGFVNDMHMDKPEIQKGNHLFLT